MIIKVRVNSIRMRVLVLMVGVIGLVFFCVVVVVCCLFGDDVEGEY